MPREILTAPSPEVFDRAIWLISHYKLGACANLSINSRRGLIVHEGMSLALRQEMDNLGLTSRPEIQFSPDGTTTVQQLDHDPDPALNFTPHAVIDCPPETFADRLGIVFEDGCDDLDYYKVAALRYRTAIDVFEFIMIQYRGMPDHMVYVQLPMADDLVTITHKIALITEALGCQDAVSWQRRDTPDA